MSAIGLVVRDTDADSFGRGETPGFGFTGLPFRNSQAGVVDGMAVAIKVDHEIINDADDFTIVEAVCVDVGEECGQELRLVAEFLACLKLLMDLLGVWGGLVEERDVVTRPD